MIPQFYIGINIILTNPAFLKNNGFNPWFIRSFKKKSFNFAALLVNVHNFFLKKLFFFFYLNVIKCLKGNYLNI